MPNPFSMLARRTGRRTVPWLAYFEVAKQIVGRGHAAWSVLSEAERRELQRVVRDFRGHPSAVPADDRRAVQRIVLKAAKAAARRRP
jgi:hypothetical protein